MLALHKRFTFQNALLTLACLGLVAACSSSSSQTPADGSTNNNDGSSAETVAWPPLLGTATPITQTQYTFVSLEGPYWVGGAAGDAGAASGNFLIFSDVVEKNMTGALIYKYDPAAATNPFSVYPYPGSPAVATSTNGLGMDSTGRLVATERWNHRVSRVETNGTLTVLASTYPASATVAPDGGADAAGDDGGADAGAAEVGATGKPFNAPNDLVIDKNNNIYFSDTLWGGMNMANNMLMPNAAYRIAAADGALVQLYAAGPDATMTSINGVALSKDGMSLYMGDDIANKLWKLPLTADGLRAGDPVLLADATKIPGNRFQIPDGINIDDDGKIYVALNHHDINAIAVFGTDGTYLGRYDVPVGIDLDPDGGAPLPAGGRGPSNITFGGADRKTLYITTLHQLYKVSVSVAGQP